MLPPRPARPRFARARAIAVATLLLGLLAVPASASAAPDLTGSWFHQERVYSQAGAYLYGTTGGADEITLQDDAGSFSGKVFDGGYPILGGVTGGTVRYWVHYTGAGSPSRYVYEGTLSDGGNVISGYGATCTEGTSSHAIFQSTFVMSLPGATTPLPAPSTSAPGPPALDLCAQPLPTGPDFRHPTTTAVLCFRGLPTDSATCEATVSDGGSPAETPSSSVTFAVPDGQGSLPDGASCTLRASTASSGSPGTCQVTYAPPAGGLAFDADVPIRATFVGDNDHRPSSADHGTSVGGSAPPPSTIVPIELPPPGDSVAATLAQCQDFATVPGNLSIPLGDYTGPDGAYGDKARNVLSCSLLASAAVAPGGKWVTQTLAASLQQLDAGSRFAQGYRTYVETAAGWQVINTQIHPWSASITRAYSTAVHDPPAPSYTRIAKATTPTVPLVRVAGSAKDRSTAKALNTWSRALAVSRGLADAFTLTVDRAGGAKKAGSPAWQGKQMRLAVTLARKLSAQTAKMVPLATKLAVLAAKSPAARKGPSKAALQTVRTRIARSGLTRAQRARLTKLGYDAGQIAAVVTEAKDKSVPTAKLLTTPAQVLADPQLVTQLRTLALYFELWAVRPEVAAGAAL